MPPESDGICGGLTYDLPLGNLQGGGRTVSSVRVVVVVVEANCIEEYASPYAAIFVPPLSAAEEGGGFSVPGFSHPPSHSGLGPRV